MPSELNLVTAPSEVLLNMARKLGIDPTQYEHENLRGVIDARTDDLRTVLNFKKTRQANRDFNIESQQQQKATQLQGYAKENRELFMKTFGGSK